MQTSNDRLERNNDRVRAHAGSERFQRLARRGALLAAVGFTALFASSSAQAETGGAGSFSYEALPPGQEIAFGALKTAGATWYGPGFYGRQTACGQILRPDVIGVAHRSLPCGTPVKFSYRGRSVLTTVIDRGPYARGYVWDLTNGARLALGLEGSSRVRYAIPLTFARG